MDDVRRDVVALSDLLAKRDITFHDISYEISGSRLWLKQCTEIGCRNTQSSYGVHVIKTSQTTPDTLNLRHRKQCST